MNGWIEQDTIEKIVTLSTCSEYDRTQQRFTVHFKKIEGNDENWKNENALLFYENVLL